MRKKIYEKNGICIEEFSCGKVGTCYELNLVGEDRLDYVNGDTQRRFTEKEMKELVADLVELRIGREKSDNKVKLIRRRKSYKAFMELATGWKTMIELSSDAVGSLLDSNYQMLDKMQAFGSRRNASLAYESLQQVKEDLRRKE